MNRDDIIAMAREAGFVVGEPWREMLIERFAALVAAATAKEYEERLRFTQERWEIECKSQVEIEREACIEDIMWHVPRSGRDTPEYRRAMKMVERIRARNAQ